MAPQDNLHQNTELREQKEVADDGKRLCEVRAVRNVVDEGGSAGCAYFSTELREGKGRGTLHQANGWRMTGSAFPMHIGRGTLYSRVAPQDIMNCASKWGSAAASARRLADFLC